MQIKQNKLGKAMEGIMCFSISGKLRQMNVGETIMFCADNNENTLRNACTRLSSQGVGRWTVAKRTDPRGYLVTRTA